MWTVACIQYLYACCVCHLQAFGSWCVLYILYTHISAAFRCDGRFSVCYNLNSRCACAYVRVYVCKCKSMFARAIVFMLMSMGSGTQCESARTLIYKTNEKRDHLYIFSPAISAVCCANRIKKFQIPIYYHQQLNKCFKVLLQNLYKRKFLTNYTDLLTRFEAILSVSRWLRLRFLCIY